MKIKMLAALALSLCLVFAAVSCDNTDPTGTSSQNGASERPSVSQTGNTGESDIDSPTAYSNYDEDDSYDESTATAVDLSGVGSVYNITQAGTYILSGTAENTQVVVNVSKEEKVQLVLKNANITCSNSAPIYVMSADKVKITIAKDTTNTITDAAQYTSLTDENEPNACIYSKDDLTINGSGVLTVSAKYNNGIGTKDDLRIIGGTINVSAANHGLKGKDSVLIAGGNIIIVAGNDGIKATNQTEKGTVTVTGGTVSIKADDDAIQAVSEITVTGGKISATAEGKVTNCQGRIDIASGCLTVVN